MDEKTVNLTLRLGHACYCRVSPRGDIVVADRLDFSDSFDFNAWLESKTLDGKEVYVVAHNIGFDVRITQSLKYLSQRGWERTVLIDEGYKFIANFRRKRSRIKFINNQQLFAVSLKSLGESIGEYKAAVDFSTVDDAELLTYCRQDVEVMIAAWRKWLAFLVEYDLGSFKITSASAAFEAFRHRFMHHDIYIHTNERAIELERRSYHGGRVECFFIGEYRDEPVTCLDINSMYPSVMLEKVPVKLLKHYPRSSLAQFAALRHKFGYIVEATLEVQTPCLPVVDAQQRLTFPTGRVRGVFCKPELEHALKQGELISVHALSVYDEAVVFDEYVHFFYEARQRFTREHNTPFAYISKLLMNSLYGKFGQRQTEFVIVGHNDDIPDGMYRSAIDSSGRLYTLRVLDGVIEREAARREAYHAFPAVASYITARARVLLDSLIERAGRENVLYCDTDSLFVTERGRAALASAIDPSLLGYLKVVGVEQGMTLRAPKSYTFGDKTVRKGVRNNATHLSPTEFVQDQFMSFSGALRARALEGVRITRVTKRMTDVYTKGVILPTGRVRPFHSPQFPQMPLPASLLPPSVPRVPLPYAPEPVPNDTSQV